MRMGASIVWLVGAPGEIGPVSLIIDIVFSRICSSESPSRSVRGNRDSDPISPHGGNYARNIQQFCFRKVELVDLFVEFKRLQIAIHVC